MDQIKNFEYFKKLLQKAEKEEFGRCLSDEQLDRLIVPKKVVIKKKKTPLQKFISKCRQHNLLIYKYKASLFWTGPAICCHSCMKWDMEKIFNNFEFQIDYNDDFTKMILYPNIPNPSTFVYDKVYDENESEMEFWEYGNVVYYVNLDTNEVFDTCDSFIGYRSNGKIVFDKN